LLGRSKHSWSVVARHINPPNGEKGTGGRLHAGFKWTASQSGRWREGDNLAQKAGGVAAGFAGKTERHKIAPVSRRSGGSTLFFGASPWPILRPGKEDTVEYEMTQRRPVQRHHRQGRGHQLSRLLPIRLRRQNCLRVRPRYFRSGRSFPGRACRFPAICIRHRGHLVKNM